MSQKSNMQILQDQKEINQSKFDEIDKRWTRVQDALRVQGQERGQDIGDLHQQLKQHNRVVSTVEAKKIQMTERKLQDLEAAASECKENLGQLFEDEANFRVDHLDEKNAFIQNYSQGADGFNKSLQQYATNRMGDLGKKLQNVNASKLQQTGQVVKEFKDVIAGAQANFQKEKERHLSMLGKVGEDANKELDSIRTLVKGCQKQKDQSETKLKLMIQTLVEQLNSACDVEEKEGETTYDSLLKTLEECCDRIQQAQLR